MCVCVCVVCCVLCVFVCSFKMRCFLLRSPFAILSFALKEKERGKKNEKFQTKFFAASQDGDYTYRNANYKPWEKADVQEVQAEGVITTLTAEQAQGWFKNASENVKIRLFNYSYENNSILNSSRVTPALQVPVSRAVNAKFYFFVLFLLFLFLSHSYSSFLFFTPALATRTKMRLAPSPFPPPTHAHNT